MSFKKLSSISLTDQFVNELQRMILSGELKAGDQLPPERELAETMGVSLAVVNNGVRRLQERGFLHVAPRKGVFVADYLREGNINTLEAVLEYGEDYYSRDIISALVAFRRSFEAPVTVTACEICTSENLAYIEDAVTRFHAETDADALGELAFEVHRSIAAASENVVYALIIASFRPIYVSSYRTALGLEDRAPIDMFFDNLLDCVREHDGERAQTILLKTIDTWEQMFGATYSEGAPYRAEQTDS